MVVWVLVRPKSNRHAPRVEQIGVRDAVFVAIPHLARLDLQTAPRQAYAVRGPRLAVLRVGHRRTTGET